LPGPLKRALDRDGEDFSILLVRLGAMGDILRTVPAMRLLRRALPLAHIEWVLDDKWRAVLDGHPDLDRIVTLPRRRVDGALRSPTHWPDLFRTLREFRSDLRRGGADLVLDFHGNLRSGLTGWSSGTPIRIGYAGHQQKEGNGLLTTLQVPAGDRRTPRVERNLDLVRALGIGTDHLPPSELPLVQTGAEEAERILRESGIGQARFAILSPAASVSQAYKIPPAETFAAACDRLHEHGLAVLVVWGPGEERLARAVVDRASPGAAVVAPATSLAALAALLSRGSLFVGADSGPLHLACATGCPVLGIYGPTDPIVNRPWGVPYRTVHPHGRQYTGIKRIDRTQGFEGLRVRDVIEAIDELVKP